jgi:hypothetical protein
MDEVVSNFASNFNMRRFLKTMNGRTRMLPAGAYTRPLLSST